MTFGTHLFPPLLLVTQQKREQGFPRDVHVLRARGIDYVYGDAGFLGISVQDRTEATDRLNCAMLALSLLFGYNLHAVRPSELAEFVVDSRGFASGFNYKQKSARTLMMWEPGVILEEYYASSQGPVPKRVLESALKLGSGFYDCSMRQTILSFYDGHTLWNQDAYAGAFLNYWIAIEAYVATLWSAYLSQTRLPGKTRKRMKRWVLANRLPILRVQSQLNAKQFGRLETLRTVRNRVVHETQLPTKQELQLCQEAATEVLWGTFRQCGIKYQNFLNEANAAREAAQP